MNDSYVELLVKRKRQITAVMAQAVLMVLGIISACLFLLTANVILFLATILFGGLVFLIRYNTIVEFEYLLVEKELSIDKIKCRSGRKKVAEYDLTNLEILAPVSSHQLDAYRDRRDIKTRDFSTGEKNDTTYALVIRTGGAIEKVLLACTDDFLNHISRFAPRKVFKD